MSNSVENQRSRQQGREKKQQTSYDLLPKETHFTKTKKNTHTQTTSPETKPRQQPQPTSPLALPADFTKFEPTYSLPAIYLSLGANSLYIILPFNVK
jgi:hypothetical protein